MLDRRAISDEAQQGCHALIAGVEPSYGYVPSLAAGIVYCVLFAIAVLYHLVRSVQYRKWPSYLLFLGALGELIGWAGRTWSSKCPYNSHAFLMQVTTLVIAPVFFAAASYVILGQLVIRRGDEYSILKPKLYLWIFVTSDVVALLVQAAGAGVASNQFNKVGGDPTKGTHIVVGGLAFQIFSMTAFIICFAYFIVKSWHFPSPRSENLVISATIISCLTIYIRCIYRTVQLAQGWTGYLSSHEAFFLALDAAMMVVAVGIYMLFDPAVLLRRSEADRVDPLTSNTSAQGDIPLTERK